MRIRLDCHYAARPEVCGLKFIWDRWDLPTELYVHAQCVSCARKLQYGLFWINSHFNGYARALSLFTSPQGHHECLAWRAAARTKRIFEAKLWRVQCTIFRQLYCVLSTVLMRLCSKNMEDASHTRTFVFGSIHLFFNQSLIISP